MITVKAFYFNDIRECTYVAYDETKECVIIDPGCQSAGEQQRLVKFIEQNNLKPVKVGWSGRSHTAQCSVLT